MKQTLKIDPRLHIGKLSELFDKPKIIRVREFTEDSLEDFEKDMADAHSTGQPVIPIVIDSFGGQVYSLLGMLSAIENAKVPVATICTTKAMSCGAILFCWGDQDHRYMDPNASIMIHDVSNFSWGKVEEIKSSAKQTDKLNKQVFTRMAKRIGHPPNFILEMLDAKKHAEWYLSAREAKKHNIANELRIPEFNVQIKVEMEFG